MLVNNCKSKIKLTLILSLIIFFPLSSICYGEIPGQNYHIDHKEKINLTKIEKDYIIENPRITVLVMEGVAPLQYLDKNGEFKGVSKLVLDEIIKSTGFDFEYIFTDSLDEIFGYNKEAIIVGISPSYAPDEMVLSKSFLKSSTILYMKSSIDPQDLDKKIYAGIKNSKLPEGVKEENTNYYYTREESLNAVESGESDYGYGNAYSVAFYTLQNGYRNIMTIPYEKESREYSIGFLNEEPPLVSIINKSLNAIDDITMQNLILNATSDIDRDITISMILDAYRNEVLAIIFAIIILLIIGIVINLRLNRKLKIQNKRYEVLAEVDGLTDLYNYSTSKALIEKKISGKDKDTMDALILLDIDFFKEINDSLGHHVGNLVLKDLAKVLKQTFRKDDIIGRVGGDEFCVYLQDIPSSEFVKDKCNQINLFADEIIKDTKLSLSMGIAMINEIDSYYKLFQMADHALYEAKDKGRNQAVLFNKNNNEDIEFK